MKSGIIMKSLIKYICLKSLLFLCVISIAQASSFYDLNEGLTHKVDGTKLKSVSYTRGAYMVSEEFRFPPQFLTQTRNMMTRETLFRDKCSIAGGTNVAQLCVYGTYKDTPEWKFVETFDPRKCKGHFYLSGNDPVLIQNAKEVRGSSSVGVHVQTVGHDKGGYIEVRQRPQPLLATIQQTVQFLERINDFIENPTPQTQELAKQAAVKHEEIKSLLAKKEEIITQLRQQVIQLKAPTQAPSVIMLSSQKCMIGILDELIMCLGSVHLIKI